ncbi:MAG: hypothetical protein ACLFNB_00660 [Candidatus Woesearchaeota archaeon]
MRALVTRDKARDGYDTYHLLKRGIPVDEELVTRKLHLYEEQYSKEALMKKIQRKERIWESELVHLTSTYPSFEEFRRIVEEKV